MPTVPLRQREEAALTLGTRTLGATMPEQKQQREQWLLREQAKSEPLEE